VCTAPKLGAVRVTNTAGCAATGTWEQRVRDLERAVAGARAELEGAIR